MAHSDSLFSEKKFFFLRMSVLLYICILHARLLLTESEKSIRSSETGVMDS